MKPRNHILLAMLKKKQGAHVKTNKAKRRKEKVALRKLHDINNHLLSGYQYHATNKIYGPAIF
jgi:hypothetical protein